MTLIKSISGFRGTIGGSVGNNLTPQDLVSLTGAFATWLIETGKPKRVVLGRDGRISGQMVRDLVVGTLNACGIDVLDLGLSTTPTVEVAVPAEEAGAGIILTASHNPQQWNALKFLNDKGEFISADDGKRLLEIAEAGETEYVSVEHIGTVKQDDSYMQYHIDQVFALDLVDPDLIRSKKYKVVVDAVNSTGSISIVPLLEQLGCEVVLINGEITGHFAHNPEPLPQHLSELCAAVKKNNADLGVAVDPDVDRLALVQDDGEVFGEEYTLVAVADYILGKTPGSTVSNLSSTRALRDVTEKHGQTYTASAVGEVNVVNMMKETNAVIGGEGNGGVIYPGLHYGRDALVGVAFILSFMAETGKSLSALKSTYPAYTISKNKIQLTPDIDLQKIFEGLKVKYAQQPMNAIDGLKIEFDTNWIHLRPSNTEPIIRIYAEAQSETVAENLADKIKLDITELLKS